MEDQADDMAVVVAAADDVVLLKDTMIDEVGFSFHLVALSYWRSSTYTARSGAVQQRTATASTIW